MSLDSNQLELPHSFPNEPETNAFRAEDVIAILRERRWLAEEQTSAVLDWCSEAGRLLGPHAQNREALAELLGLVFVYDARRILSIPENQAVVAREWAKRVIRLLAHLVLEGGEVDSDRFKAIVNSLREQLTSRGRELFHPVRLALAGRAGEGELDRVILLLDSASALPFRVPAKGTHQRMIEFCAALD
jgi:hypothetical protein